MPGVNLTGNSATGSRGNNRQIDIRGMGPENTLILIDGVPVTSRNSVRYSWRGSATPAGILTGFRQRWLSALKCSGDPLPPAMVRGGRRRRQHHYQTPDQRLARLTLLYTNQPENDKEGSTKRANFDLSGPLRAMR